MDLSFLSNDIEMFHFEGLRIDDGKPHDIEVIISSSIISISIDGQREEMYISETADRPMGNLFIGNVQESTK